MQNQVKLFIFGLSVALVTMIGVESVNAQSSRNSYPRRNYNGSAYKTPQRYQQSNTNKVVQRMAKSGQSRYSSGYSRNRSNYYKKNVGQQGGTYHRYTQQGTAHSKGTKFNSAQEIVLSKKFLFIESSDCLKPSNSKQFIG